MASSSKKEPLPSALSHPLPCPSKPSGKAVDGAGGGAKPGSQPHLPDEPAAVDILSPSPEETALAKSSHLSRQELLRRRFHHRKQLSRVYRDYYWALMEEVRVQYRDYYWRFGVSPYTEDDDREVGGREMGSVNVEGSGETNNYINNNNCSLAGGNINGVGGGGGVKSGLTFREGGGFESKFGGSNRCASVGCKFTAMALTAFCHLHILSDPQQKLYKACNFVIKSELWVVVI